MVGLTLNRSPKWLRYSLFVALAALLVWLCLGVGLGSWTHPSDIPEALWGIRWPRIAVALMVGGALACSGAALQALFGNPLADPSLIGTSSGAALGVVLVLAFGLGGMGVPLAAFVGAVAACLFVLSTHHLFGGGRLGLLIIGFVVSAFCGAVVSLILFLSDDMVLRSATVWLAGSLAGAGFVPIYYALAVMVLGWLVLLWVGRDLDCLMLGEETALSMGVNLNRTKLVTVIGAALLTGAAVSLSGVIGFVGMMVPNVLAAVCGGGRGRLMVLSGIVGALFLLLIDSAARHVAYPIDLPVGIVISLLGAPFFLWLFLKGNKGRA